MNIPCPNVLPCDCTVSPFANLSQETPDLPFFFSTFFGRGLVPLGAQAFQTNCVTVCANAPTQAQADLCAQEQAYLCSNNYGFPNPALPFAPPAPPPQSLIDGIPFSPFFNNPQTGSALCPDGNFSEFIVPAGSFAGSSQQAVDESALSYANRQARLGQICITFNLTETCVGQPVTIIATATGARLATGMNTNNWIVTTLPPGLETIEGNIIGNQLFITGTPTMAGSYTIFVTLTDPVGDTITVPYDLFVAGITDPTLPSGKTGQAYIGILTVAGFQSPVVFSLFSGTLPPGLSLGSSGVISGIPTAAGNYTFDVQVTDGRVTCIQPIKLLVAGGLDFNNLVWEFPNGYSLGGSGSSGGNANSYHGAKATVDAIVPTGVSDGWGNQALMTYTGPLTACQVKITLVSFSGGNASAASVVQIYQDGNQLVSQVVQVFPTTINFTVQAGNASQIQIGIEPASTGITGVGVSCDIVDFPGPNFEGIVNFEFLPHS